MAFTSNITSPDGRIYENAYIKVTPTVCNAQHGCSMILEVWDSQANKDAGYASVFTTAHNLAFNANLPSVNAVDYAYQLLEDSELYPDAVWNQ